MVTRVKLFIDNMIVYLKNLRISKEKLLETIMEHLSLATITESDIQKLVNFLHIYQNQTQIK